VEGVVYKENYYALAMCMLTPKMLSVEKACIQMGIKMDFIDKPVGIITEYEKDTNRKVPMKSIPEIANLYFKEHIGLKEIGDIYGVTRDCITYNLKKSGYVIDSKHGRKTKIIGISKIEYKSLKRQGLNDQKIKIIADCSAGTLSKYKKDWGLIK